MRLALIRRHSADIGGAELYIQRLMEALVEAGHEVTLFTEHWAGLPPGVRLHTVPSSGPRRLRPIRFAEAVDRELRPSEFDCVFSLERTLRQDVYRAGDGLHRTWLEQRRRFAPWWRRPFFFTAGFHRAMCRLEARTLDPGRTRRVIVNSEMVATEIQRHFGFPPDRIHRVRNGIHVERFQKGDRDGCRGRFGIQPDDFLLLFVGSGWERKGLPQLFKALRHPVLAGRPFRLLVVGKGRIAGAPPQVVFAGPMRDVENAYAAADLLTFIPIYEPSANVVIEARAAGLPVITSVFNGAAEWLTPGLDGDVLSDPSDSAAVARAIVGWMDRGRPRPGADIEAMRLSRNVSETVAVLELAARERCE
jgi:UDP-glucose:(heptosyl)LPS alpha-1,3-glucosyltransferase